MVDQVLVLQLFSPLSPFCWLFCVCCCSCRFIHSCLCVHFIRTIDARRVLFFICCLLHFIWQPLGSRSSGVFLYCDQRPLAEVTHTFAHLTSCCQLLLYTNIEVLYLTRNVRWSTTSYVSNHLRYYGRGGNGCTDGHSTNDSSSFQCTQDTRSAQYDLPQNPHECTLRESCSDRTLYQYRIICTVSTSHSGWVDASYSYGLHVFPLCASPGK